MTNPRLGHPKLVVLPKTFHRRSIHRSACRASRAGRHGCSFRWNECSPRGGEHVTFLDEGSRSPRSCVSCPLLGAAQGRTTGQIVGTVKDASGGVVPKADLILIDNGTGTTVEAKSGSDGDFVFPNLQPGRYQITATVQGFQPVTIQEVVVETARSIDVVVQFEVAGVTEQVDVEGRSQVVETTSTTVANTVSNEQIAKLPLAGRNILELRAARAGRGDERRRPRQRVQRPAGRRDQHHARRRQQQLAAVPQRRHELLHVRARSGSARSRK